MENYVLSNNEQLITFKGVPIQCGLTTNRLGSFALKDAKEQQMQNFLNAVQATKCLRMKPAHGNQMIYCEPGEAHFVKPFNCDGILFEVSEKEFITFLHCGRKSLYQNILKIAVKDFMTWGNVAPSDIGAIVYSGICPSCYTVMDDVYDEFIGIDRNYKQFFTSTNGKSEYQFDLAGLIKWSLTETGLPEKSIHCFDLCSNHYRLKDLRPQLFGQDGNQFLLFSQRRDEEERNFFFARVPDDKTVIAGTTGNCPYVILYHNSKK